MSDSNEAAVSRALAAAWGQYERPTKGPKPGLSLDGILDAAIEVATRDGLAMVSMKRVADELGTAPMSLYRYVSSKDELVQLMVDRAFGPPPGDVPAPEDSWRSGLTRWAWAQHETLWRTKWALAAPIPGPPAGPHQVRWLERGLRCLAGTGLAEGEKMGTVSLVTTFVRADVTLTVQLQQGMAQTGKTTPAAGYSQLLRQLTDPERFPAVTAVLDSGIFEEVEAPDEDFVFGLERILDGLDQLIRTRI